MWDNLKKNLKDFSKRENEFQTLCRNEVNADFWSETIVVFKDRVKAYERKLQEGDLLEQESSIVEKQERDAVSLY